MPLSPPAPVQRGRWAGKVDDRVACVCMVEGGSKGCRTRSQERVVPKARRKARGGIGKAGIGGEEREKGRKGNGMMVMCALCLVR